MASFLKTKWMICVLVCLSSHSFTEEKKENHKNVEASLDFIYWNVHENGLEYAFKNEGSTVIANNSKAKNLDFHASPGFKAGLGYIFPNNSWKIFLELTRLHNKNEADARAHEGEALFPVWFNAVGLSPGFVEKASARFRLHFGTLDLILSRSFHLTGNVTLIPYLGLEGAIIRQKYILRYSGGTLFPGMEDRTSVKNKFFAGGPLVGLRSEWNFYRWLSLYADAGLALLYGSFYVHESERLDGDERRLKMYNMFTASSLSVGLSLGLKARQEFQRWGCEGTIAWENLLFTNQNQMLRFNNQFQGSYASSPEDLHLQGLTLGLQFDF